MGYAFEVSPGQALGANSIIYPHIIHKLNATEIPRCSGHQPPPHLGIEKERFGERESIVYVPRVLEEGLEPSRPSEAPRF